MSVEIWAGGQAPEAYALDLTSTVASGPDYSTVTAAVLRVKMQDGSLTTWACTMSNKTATTLTLTHIFNLDVTVPGIYRVYARLTVPAGIVRSRPKLVTVHDEYHVAG